jgi:hypothetical protein
MLCFRLELVLLDCSVGLLGREDEVPADSASGTDLLLTDCSGNSDAGAEDTAFGTVAAELGAGSVWTAEVGCLRNEAIAASRLGSTDLTLAILHLFALPLCHDCSVNQVLKCGEGVIHQLILQRVDQASQKTILPLGVGVDIFRSIARQLQKPISVLTDRHWPLFEC